MSVRTKGFAIVLQSVKELDAKVLVAGRIGMEAGLLATVSVAQREYLSGPRPDKLDVRSTRLRNSISSSAKIVGTTNVIGRIGSNVKYAAFHEFGFHGKISVGAHTRVTQQLNALGFAIDTRRVLVDARGNRIGYKESRKRASDRQKNGSRVTAAVAAHQRTIKYDGRPFVHPAVEKSLPMILARIEEQIGKIKSA